MDTNQLMDAFNNDQSTLTLIPALYPYFPVLARVNDPIVNDKFVDLVSKKQWVDVDALMWGYLTEDERDKVSGQILQDARKTVDNLFIAEKIFKQVVLKLLEYAIKMI